MPGASRPAFGALEPQCNIGATCFCSDAQRSWVSLVASFAEDFVHARIWPIEGGGCFSAGVRTKNWQPGGLGRRRLHTLLGFGVKSALQHVASGSGAERCKPMPARTLGRGIYHPG